MTGRRRGGGICHRLGARAAKRARKPSGGKAGLAAAARAEPGTAAAMTARARATMDRHGGARLNLGRTLALRRADERVEVELRFGRLAYGLVVSQFTRPFDDLARQRFTVAYWLVHPPPAHEWQRNAFCRAIDGDYKRLERRIVAGSGAGRRWQRLCGAPG